MSADTKSFVKGPGSAAVIGLLADKWTIPVIHSLARSTKRTAQLKRDLGVSQKMLTQTLRNLEKHGLVDRTVHSAKRPHVDYRLTALGRSLNGPLAEICRWAKRHGHLLARTPAAPTR